MSWLRWNIRSVGLLLPMVVLATQTMSQAVPAKGTEDNASGRAHARNLIARSVDALEKGRTKEAIELATIGSSEAEKHGHYPELAEALMQLARAHRVGNNLDHAIGATLRVTLVQSIHHSPVRTEALLQLAELYLNAGHPHKALEHLTAAASSTGAPHMDQSRFMRNEARAKTQVMTPDAVIPQLEQYLEASLTRKDLELELNMRAMLATALANSDRHQEALACEEAVLALAVRLDRPAEAAICANNMGALNHRMGRIPEALNAYAKGLIMVEDLPYVRLNMQMNAALAHARNGNHATALWMMDEAMQAIKKGRSPELAPRALRAMAAIHLGRGDLPAAQSFALDAHAAAEAQGDLPEQIAACDMLASIFERLGLPQEVKVQARKARDLEQLRLQQEGREKSKREDQLLRLQRVEREQVDLLNREQRKESKLRQLALDAENRESQFALLTYEGQLQEAARREAVLAREQMDHELRLTQAALEAERKDRMLKELDNENMVQSLTVARMEFDRKEQLKTMELLEQHNEVVEVRARMLEAEQLRDRTMKWVYILLACVAVLVAALMARAFVVGRRKARTIAQQNEQIKGINHELAAKNNDIQSSINYARTIQEAILPGEEDLHRSVGNGFMLYKPLDIVSGDLPFIHQSGDKVIVAAIDCTGHGVPAAMMTFIAYYGLKELLARSADLPAGEILDQLHDHVKETMRARSKETLYNDGFDIGLCVLDTATGVVSYAGAQLPLLRVSGNEVTRIRGDVFPLGDEHFKRSAYQTHTLQLDQGDSLYMLSDGIIHQFGGPEGLRKFSMKRLMEILGNTSGMELNDVKQHMEQQFIEWKGSVPQTDDVLLIGLRYAA